MVGNGQSTRVSMFLLSPLAALAVGLVGAWGDPKPGMLSAPGSPEIFRTPSLWEVVRTDDYQPGPVTTRMCINSPGMFSAMFKNVKLQNDCKMSKSTLASGAITLEAHCKSAFGDKLISNDSMRLEASRDGKSIHQHFENQMQGLEPGLGSKSHVMDAAMTYLGPCPAPMRPDQTMLIQGADGKFVDLLGAVGRASKALTPPTPDFAPSTK